MDVQDFQHAMEEASCSDLKAPFDRGVYDITDHEDQASIKSSPAGNGNF